jgi:hypothetical protein
MAWAKFSDDWATSPHIITLSPSAFRAYMGLVLYCAKWATDGHIPPNATSASKAAMAELVRTGLLEVQPCGHYLPRWREHTISKADAEKARAAVAERQRRRRGGHRDA